MLHLIKKKICKHFNLVDCGQNLFEIARGKYLEEEKFRLTRLIMELEADNHILRLKLLNYQLKEQKRNEQE